MILIGVEGRTVGIVVNQVTDVFGTGGADLRPPPELGDGDRKRGLAGVTTHDGRLVFVLDVNRSNNGYCVAPRFRSCAPAWQSGDGGFP